MKSKKLHLYYINMKYIRDLSQTDHHVMSVSPQIGKESRPFAGIVVICHDKFYCIPLSSPKSKHQKMKNDKDFSKILDKNGNLIGVLNFNNMIPVSQNVIRMIDIKIHADDTQQEIAYKNLLHNQINWCNDNIEMITNKANKLYTIVTETPDKMISLTKRCCNFKKLEQVLEKWKNK